MANTDVIDEDAPKKSGKMGMILGLVLALAAGGGGFFASYSGMLPIGGSESSADDAEVEAAPMPELAKNVFLPLDPILVNIRSSSKFSILRFLAQIEIAPEYQADIEAIKPRVIDVMNTYLNALEAKSFEDPIAMIKLRAQLLRRIQIVTGEGRVKDLLIMEFILQ
jgi:flagellar FliL protein